MEIRVSGMMTQFFSEFGSLLRLWLFNEFLLQCSTIAHNPMNFCLVYKFCPQLFYTFSVLREILNVNGSKRPFWKPVLLTHHSLFVWLSQYCFMGSHKVILNCRIIQESGESLTEASASALLTLSSKFIILEENYHSLFFQIYFP